MPLDSLLDRLPDLLKERRAELQLSQGDVARAVGVAQSTVARWESGERVPASATLLRLLMVLRSGLDDLVR